jgi:hypothetical protein
LFGTVGVPGTPGSYGVQYHAAKRQGDEDDMVQEETAEDKAISRIYTLRSILEKYMKKVSEIRRAIKALKEERRRLLLICRNIGSDRVYKLDINKLSAFGFENID